MKKIGILTNPTRDIGGEYRDYILASFPNIKFLLLENDDIEKLVKESNICITLGGDGTMLNIASLCAKYNTYIYGINLGSVGYLTDVSKEKGIEAIKKLLLENFEKEERMMIACDDYTALNDICIVKGSSSKMIILEIFINGHFIDSFKADGIIISTPTGSTAYNLAAGGPILDPALDNIILTPIAPHKLSNRPLVVSANSEIRVRANNSQLVVDGINKIFADEYVIKKASENINILRTEKVSFYSIVKEKFLL